MINEYAENKIKEQKKKEIEVKGTIEAYVESLQDDLMESLNLYREQQRNKTQGKLDKVWVERYNELMEDYPEYSQYFNEFIPNINGILKPEQRIRIVASILMALFYVKMVQLFEEILMEVYTDEKQLQKNWNGQTFYIRLAVGVSAYIYTLTSKINLALAQGKYPEDVYNMTQLLKSIIKVMSYELSHAYRYQEALTLIKDGYITYTFYTSEDERVCSQCRPLHEKEFKLEDAIIGENFPPLHWWCRCWILGGLKD